MDQHSHDDAPEAYEPPRAEDVATEDTPSVTAAGGKSPVPAQR